MRDRSVNWPVKDEDVRGIKGNDNRVSMEGEWEIFCESYLWSKVLVFIAYYINQVQTREKTFSNKEKAWLPLIQWATKLRKVNWKMMFMLIWVIVDRRLQQFLLIRKKFFLFSSKIIQNKFKLKKWKRNFSCQALEFLSPGKPGLYIHNMQNFSSLNIIK